MKQKLMKKLVSAFFSRSLSVGWLKPEPDHTSSRISLGEGGVVPGGCNRRAHRRRPDPGAAHHVGTPHVAQREQAAPGPEAADALALALQLPWT